MNGSVHFPPRGREDVAWRIHPLRVGTLPAFPREALVLGRAGETIDVAIHMFVLEGAAGLVVVDTGAPEPEAVRRLRGFIMLQDADHEPDVALRNAGFDPADVRLVINTHLHWDHCGNNDLFPNARFVVQAAELEYALRPSAEHRSAYYLFAQEAPAWLEDTERLWAVSGDTPLLDGVDVVHLPGHTPGSQGVVVHGEHGRQLLAGDCVSTYANWHDGQGVRGVPSGTYSSLSDFHRSFARIEGLDAEVIPSHDPAVSERSTVT